MRTELMIEAICWETDSKVTADYAHAMHDFSYFCPHIDCLREVHAKRKKNTYFVAREKHVPGCPNEAQEVESDGTALEPKKKQSIVPASPIPTELGPNCRPPKKKQKPTQAELLALAGALKSQQPYCAGTLEEVVSAWLAMESYEKDQHPLTIRGTRGTYRTAFYFLGAAGTVSVTTVPFADRIVYGAAHISYDDQAKCFWVRSAKEFPSTVGKASLAIQAPESSPAGVYIKSLLPQGSTKGSCTLCCSGNAPRVSRSGKSYMLPNDISDKYWRFVLSDVEAA